MSDPAPAPAIDSRADWAAAIRWSLDAAIARDARRITWVDRDWADWPLDDPALHQALVGWLRRPMRRLVLIAATYDAMPRRHPRFVAWRSAWAHAIEAWAPSEEARIEWPTLAVDDAGVVVELIDPVRGRGRAAIDPRARREWSDRVDAWLQHCEPAFPVRSLGL